MHGVVHHRAAARELGIEEPSAWDLAVVRAAYGQHATQGSAAHDLPRAGHRGEVAYWKGRPELAARVLGGLDHGPRVLDGGRDGLLTEHVHAALESRDHIPSVVLVLGADDDGLDLLEEGGCAIEEPHTEMLGCFSTATCVFVRNTDEIRGVEIP